MDYKFIPDNYEEEFNINEVHGLYRLNECSYGSRVWLPAYKKVFTSANLLEVTVGTNGYCGGDAGHGSRTVLRIRDASGTNIRYALGLRDSWGDPCGIELALGGDCELDTMIGGLRFAADALERLAREACEKRKRNAG